MLRLNQLRVDDALVDTRWRGSGFNHSLLNSPLLIREKHFELKLNG